jgi:hypothetical protein
MQPCHAFCAPPDHIDAFWPVVSPLIREAMKRGDIMDLDAVEIKVRTGQALLWIAWDGSDIQAAAVTEIFIANGQRFCTVVACGGSDRDRWLPLLGQLEDYASREQCTSALILGRPGWKRLLKSYRVKGLILEKQLTPKGLH